MQKYKNLKENKEKYDENIITVLDIGTSNIVVVVVKIISKKNFEIIGISKQKSYGIIKGMITNINIIINSLKKVFEDIELTVNYKIKNVYTNITGSHIRSFNSSGIIAVKNDKITSLDVCKVIEIAKSINIKNNNKIIHILIQDFIIDEKYKVQEPIGMNGIKLEVRVNIITCSFSAYKNIVNCIKKCGVEIKGLVVQSLSSSLACLKKHEKEIGVLLIDIGGGTTDLSIFIGGSIYHSAVIPIAGDQITNDISTMLHIPVEEAEEIKLKYGAAKKIFSTLETIIEIPGKKNKQNKVIKHKDLCDIIESRIEELFLIIKKLLIDSDYNELISSGVVITGGTSKIKGIIELSEDIFKFPTRIAYPNYIKNLSNLSFDDCSSSSIGLIYEAKTKFRKNIKIYNKYKKFMRILNKIRYWFLS